MISVKERGISIFKCPFVVLLNVTNWVRKLSTKEVTGRTEQSKTCKAKTYNERKLERTGAKKDIRRGKKRVGRGGEGGQDGVETARKYYHFRQTKEELLLSIMDQRQKGECSGRKCHQRANIAEDGVHS